jgi:hypothetical protein
VTYMLESLFSKQVAVPFLHQPFPITLQDQEERLFRSITFPEDTVTAVRLRAIDHNYRVTSTVSHRSVNLGIPEEEWNHTTDKLRIKAFLSIAQDGVVESHWVTQHHADYENPQTYNQYRVRGVSKQGYLSDWVYSEIRDQENDLVLFELLYDLLDILEQIHDKNIAYALDYTLSDLFQYVWKSNNPISFASLVMDEQWRAAIDEFHQILSTVFAETMEETMFASPSEFAHIMKVHHLIDQYKESKRDFIALLLEQFLEDYYEQAIKKVNMEVMLRNDEKMAVLLQSFLEMDVKDEWIRLLHNIEFSDHFVTSINDVVELIADPIVFEQLRVLPKEWVEKFMRLAFEEVYHPFLLDQRDADLLLEPQDEMYFNQNDNIIEFDKIRPDDIYRFLFVHDVIDLLLNEWRPHVEEYDLQLLERILKVATSHYLSIQLEYSPVELIEMILDISERFLIRYQLLSEWAKDFLDVRMIEDSSVLITNDSHVTSDSQYVANQEHVNVLGLKKYRDAQQDVWIQTKDRIEAEEMYGTLSVQNRKVASACDDYDLNQKAKHMIESLEVSSRFEEYHDIQATKRRIAEKLLQHVLLNEYVIHTCLKSSIDVKELLVSATKDEWEVKWKSFLASNNILPLQSFITSMNVTTDLEDHFKIDGHESVRFALGEIGQGWPLGSFVLGANTLKGSSGTPIEDND